MNIIVNLIIMKLLVRAKSSVPTSNTSKVNKRDDISGPSIFDLTLSPNDLRKTVTFDGNGKFM